MPDWHYHANHIDAPARGSKDVAMKDARDLRLNSLNMDGWLVDPGAVTAEMLKTHGSGFPLVVKCFRPDCAIQRKEVAAMRER